LLEETEHVAQLQGKIREFESERAHTAMEQPARQDDLDMQNELLQARVAELENELAAVKTKTDQEKSAVVALIQMIQTTIKMIDRHVMKVANDGLRVVALKCTCQGVAIYSRACLNTALLTLHHFSKKTNNEKQLIENVQADMHTAFTLMETQMDKKEVMRLRDMTSKAFRSVRCSLHWMDR